MGSSSNSAQHSVSDSPPAAMLETVTNAGRLLPEADSKTERGQTPYHERRSRLALKYDTVETKVQVADSHFFLVKVRDTNKLLDDIDPEPFARDERMPYWADVWASSIELARYCLETGTIRGKRVLELGGGLGLAGIAAARAGALVTITDYEEDALEFVRCNVEMNPPATLGESVTVRNFDWRDGSPPGKFHVVIASDIIYERNNFFPILRVLRQAVVCDGLAVFTEPARAVGEEFFRLAAQEGFAVQTTQCETWFDGRTHAIVRADIFPGQASCP